MRFKKLSATVTITMLIYTKSSLKGLKLAKFWLEDIDDA